MIYARRALRLPLFQERIMSVESNRALALAYFPAFRDRDEEWWEVHIAPEFVRHDAGLDFPVVGPAGTRKLASVLHGGFSNI
ncbi:hypothetical protein ASE91_17380 [Sphingomonas sp. Leaf62]|nr:hypothetical protein ASE91_17380 [Sphingomonas sp. Leaf62]